MLQHFWYCLLDLITAAVATEPDQRDKHREKKREKK
jgi:hypothetical protein